MTEENNIPEQDGTEDGVIAGETQEPSVAERRKFTDIPERQAIAEGREPIGMSVAEWEDFHEGLVPYLGLNPKAKLLDSVTVKNSQREWMVKECKIIAERDINSFVHALMSAFTKGWYYPSWASDPAYMAGPLYVCPVYSFQPRPPKIKPEDQELLDKTGSVAGAARDEALKQEPKKRGPKPKKA